MEFVGIYDADGTLVGELRYALGKLTGRAKCALCDITHGWNPVGSRQWKQACAASPLKLDLIHRDEATPAQLATVTTLPSILSRAGADWREAMTSAEITDCAGSPEALLEQLAQL